VLQHVPRSEVVMDGVVASVVSSSSHGRESTRLAWQ